MKEKYPGDQFINLKIFISNFIQIFPGINFFFKNKLIYTPFFPFFFLKKFSNISLKFKKKIFRIDIGEIFYLIKKKI